MRALYSKLLVSQTGVTAIEYGLIAALVALAAIAAWSTLGSHLSSEFNSIASSV